MRIIDRYLIKEVLYALAAITPILLLIFVSNRFLAYLADAAAGKLPADVIFTLLSLKSISVLTLILPLTFYLSVVFALGRIYKDSEMTVLAACGMSTMQVLKIMLVPALGLAILVALLAMYVDPWANGQSKQVEQRIEAGSELSTIVPGRFKESRRGDHVFYAEQFSPDYQFMRNVFIQSRQRGKLNVLSSETGAQYVDKKTGDQYIVLKDGSRYEWTSNSMDYKIAQYKKYTLRIQEKNPLPTEQERDVKEMSALLDSTQMEDIAELQWRFSMPISALLLTMLAVLLARTTPRQGRYAKLFVAILVYIIYNNMMSVARSWVEHSVVTPLVGIWWVHGVMLLGIVVLIIQQMKLKWPFQIKWFARAG